MAALDDSISFLRAHATPVSVPLVPEIQIYMATDMTPLWHASAQQNAGWDDSPFWAFPWAGGQALSRYLLDHPQLVRGKHVFDFATGSGLVAIAAATAGAARVLANDLDPFCQAAVHANSELNGVAVEFEGVSQLGQPLPGFDVVLAGDIFYERPLAEQGLRWLQELASGGKSVFVGDPGRLYSPMCLRELALYDVPTSTELEATSMRRTSVMAVDPPGSTPPRPPLG